MNLIEKTCGTCQKYAQHYNITKHNVLEVRCGHCKKTMKSVNPHKKACAHYVYEKKSIETEKKELVENTLENINKNLEHIKLYIVNK